MPLVPSAISGSVSDQSRVSITGSVVCLGADPDIPIRSPAVGIDTAFFISGSVGGKSKGMHQSVSVFGGDAIVSGTTYVSGTIATLSDAIMMFDAAGDINLNSDTGTWVFADAATAIMTITNSSNDVVFTPLQANKDIKLATSDNNVAASVDSSNDAFFVQRKLGLTSDAVQNSDGTLSAITPFGLITNNSSSPVTGTLGDPTFQGQLKFILGLQSSSGAVVLSFKNAGGITQTKALSSGTGVLLIGFDASGAGAFRWAMMGDVSS